MMIPSCIIFLCVKLKNALTCSVLRGVFDLPVCWQWGDINALVMNQKKKKGTALIDYKTREGAVSIPLRNMFKNSCFMEMLLESWNCMLAVSLYYNVNVSF